MYRRIATEEAFATPAQVAESKRLLKAGGQEPGFAKLGGIIFGDSPGAKMIESMLLDIGDGRLAQMDKDGIDLSILSLTSPRVQVFEASRAVLPLRRCPGRRGLHRGRRPEPSGALGDLRYQRHRLPGTLSGQSELRLTSGRSARDGGLPVQFATPADEVVTCCACWRASPTHSKMRWQATASAQKRRNLRRAA